MRKHPNDTELASRINNRNAHKLNNTMCTTTNGECIVLENDEWTNLVSGSEYGDEEVDNNCHLEFLFDVKEFSKDFAAFEFSKDFTDFEFSKVPTDFEFPKEPSVSCSSDCPNLPLWNDEPSNMGSSESSVWKRD